MTHFCSAFEYFRPPKPKYEGEKDDDGQPHGEVDLSSCSI
jgi:hypothetical protein